MERLDGEIRDREKVFMGLKGTDAAIPDGMKVYNPAKKHGPWTDVPGGLGAADQDRRQEQDDNPERQHERRLRVIFLDPGRKDCTAPDQAVTAAVSATQ